MCILDQGTCTVFMQIVKYNFITLFIYYIQLCFANHDELKFLNLNCSVNIVFMTKLHYREKFCFYVLNSILLQYV